MTATRKQHLRMKYSLAAFAMNKTDDFMKLFSTKGKALEKIWDNASQSYPPEDRVPGTGALTATVDIPGVETVLLILPKPAQRNEAYFIVVMRSPGAACRVFALESAMDPQTGKPYTVLAEFRANGRANWGPGPEPKPEEFIRHSFAIASDATARPQSFTELPIIQM